MTSLIDVIFLLLLFFMLSSTFSKFAEVELAAASGGAAAQPDRELVFLQLTPETLLLNGETTTLEALPATLASRAQDDQNVLVSMRQGVKAQRLIDLLVALRGVDGLNVTVLEAT